MLDLRVGQAKIATCPELKGTLGYVPPRRRFRIPSWMIYLGKWKRKSVE